MSKRSRKPKTLVTPFVQTRWERGRGWVALVYESAGGDVVLHTTRGHTLEPQARRAGEAWVEEHRAPAESLPARRSSEVNQ